MRDVHVTAQNELAPVLELRQVQIELFQKTKLRLLAFLAGRAAGEVATDEGALGRGCVKTQFHVTALRVKLGRTVADPHIAGFVPAVETNTGVTLFLGKMKVAAQAGQMLKSVLHVRGLGLDLLYTNTIRLSFGEPGFQAFGGSRADAIEVEAG